MICYYYFDEDTLLFRIPTDEEVLQVIEQFLPNPDTLDIPLIIRRIKNILKKDNRYLIHVFSLNHDDNVAETIFKAIFGMYDKETYVMINFILLNSKNQEK